MRESAEELRKRLDGVEEAVVMRGRVYNRAFRNVVFFYNVFLPTEPADEWMCPLEILRAIHALGVKRVHFVGGGKPPRTFRR